MQHVLIDDEPGEQMTGVGVSAVMTPKQSSERWIFACGTEFHLFVAYMLCSMAPIGCRRTLVLQINHRIAAFAENARQTGVWDGVLIVQDSHQEPDAGLLALEADETARFFYFSWGFPALNQAVAKRDGQIAEILRSRSWRITAPYRWLGRFRR